MYHEDTDTPAVARTSNLNEELGQVLVLAVLLAWGDEIDFASPGNVGVDSVKKFYMFRSSQNGSLPRRSSQPISWHGNEETESDTTHCRMTNYELLR